MLLDEVASVNTDERTFSDYIAMLKRRWRNAVGVGGLITFGFIVAAFAIPAVYEATAIIQIESPEIPQNMIQTTVSSYSEELLASVTQRVLVTENIMGLIDRFKLFPELRQSTPDDVLVDQFRMSTSVTPTAVDAANKFGRQTAITYAFTVSFRYDDPKIASDVANELAKMHTEASSALRATSAARTSAFLQAETAKVEKRIKDVEAQIAALQRKVGGGLVTENPLLAAQRFEQLDNELAQIGQDLRAAHERKDLLESDLLQTPLYRPLLSDGQPVVRGSDRLAIAQQELLALQARYSDDHPDILRLKREISGLSAGSVDYHSLATQLRANILATEQDLAAAQQAYSDSHPDVVRLKRTLQTLQQQLADAERRASTSGTTQPVPDNPVYLQLQTRLRSAEQEINDLTRRRSELQGRIGQYAYNPAFESSYGPLARERDLLQAQYKDLREKLTQASLTQTVETDEKGQVLTLVEPARAPTSPIEPNRPMLIFLGLVLGLTAAFGIAALADAMDAKVRGSHDVATLLHVSPLAMIPYIHNPSDFARRRKKRIVIGIAALSMCVLAVVLIV